MVQRQSFSVEGSVRRIRLQNFMTYLDETFWPGPGFNVIVGPNGSGKSSIVTALCVCLGGEIQYLNRQSDLSSLVNNSTDCTEAMVEVELFVPDKPNNLKVTCKIFKNGSDAIFKLNDKKISRSELITVTSDLQIQPGNMCQFLPQDVVRDFPTLSNQQIFYNTVKAVGNMSLIETYDKLKKLQSDLETLQDQYDTKSGTLQGLEKKKSRLDDDMEAYEKRKELEERKEVIQNSIKWEQFKSLRKQVKETRDRERDLKNNIDKLEAKQKPLRDFLQGFEDKQREMKKKVDTADKVFQESSYEVEELDITEKEETIERLKEHERDLVQQEDNRISGKDKIKQEIRELQEYLATNKPGPELDKKIEELNSKKSNQTSSLERHEQLQLQQQYNIDNLKREKAKSQKAYDDLQDKKNRKLEILLRENPDTYKGVLWLRENLDKFKAPVHEPIMLSIEVKNRELAKYVETHIGRADLEGFVCEDPDDVNRLTKQLREVLKLKRINAFHSNPDPPSQFSHKVSREELGKYDLVDYISDMYTAPDAVHAYLCRQKALHQVPVFRQENNWSGEIKSKFHNYYIGTQKFNSKRSKYSGELSTGMEDIGGRQVIRLAATVDTMKAESLKAELEEKDREISSSQKRLETYETTCGNIKLMISKTDEEINKIRAVKREFSSKQSELDMKKRTLQQMMKPRFNLEDEVQKIKTQKVKLTVELSQQVQQHLKLVEKRQKAESQRGILHLALQNLESENSENKEKLAGLDRDLASAVADHSLVEERWDRDKKALQKCHTEARKATGVLSNDIKYKPPLSWQAKFEALGSSDENVLAAYLDECDRDLKFLKKIDDRTVNNIEEIRSKLSTVKEEVKSLDAEMANKKHDARRLKSKWVRGVQELVENVDEKFSRMMADLGYNGQVSLSEGKAEIDFSSYGIKIQVRFREGEALQDLSKGTQSGGEKSVSTAVYMMALQELTQVPFRCVDEINQGMDEKNERSIWGMLLEVCKKHQAQYFYMAPKFPNNLPFNRQVTMLICNNGLVDKTESAQFDTAKFVKVAQRLKRK